MEKLKTAFINFAFYLGLLAAGALLGGALLGGPETFTCSSGVR